MFCGNCYTVCPALPLADPLNDGISIWVGGKVSNARTEPMFSKLAIPFLPNNPPRWPEVVQAVRKIIEVAKAPRSTSGWASGSIASGGSGSSKSCDIPFTYQHIDEYRWAYDTYRTSMHFKF